MRRTSLTVLSFLLCVLLALSFSARGVSAEDSSQGYKYTVKVYAGNHGGFGGSTEWSATYTYGESVNISLADIGFAVTNTKYRVIGVRLTGLDDIYASGDENLTFSVEKIEKDMSFVVAYAMNGEVMEYSVRFVDENGTDLTSPVTYYGMVGDAIVINHLYFQGYTPVAAGADYIISADPAQNNFVISYSKIPVPVVSSSGGGGGGSSSSSSSSSSSGQTASSSQNTQEGTSSAEPAAGQQGNGTQASSADPSQDGAQSAQQPSGEGNQSAQQQGGTQQGQGSGASLGGGTAASTQTGTSQREGGMPLASKVAIGLSALMLLAAVIAAIVLRRKKN